MTRPKISVVMPCYNSSNYLEDSIESILSQSYENLEFIIIDDGSTDNSVEVINRFKDSRIKVVANKCNNGNYFCRNIGTSLAKGDYIAVMDSDDIAEENRLSIELDAIEENSNIVCVTANLMIFNETRSILSETYTTHEDICIALLKNNVIKHPTLLVRKTALQELNGYDEHYLYSSDYDLACRISKLGVIVGIPKVVVKYRLHSQQITSLKHIEQANYANHIRLNYLSMLGFEISEDESDIYTKVMTSKPLTDMDMDNAIDILNKLIEQNDKLKLFNEDKLYDFFRSVL